MKPKIGTPEWWPLQTGGHCMEVVVSSGLTVHQTYVRLRHPVEKKETRELERRETQWVYIFKMFFFVKENLNFLKRLSKYNFRKCKKHL